MNKPQPGNLSHVAHEKQAFLNDMWQGVTGLGKNVVDGLWNAGAGVMNQLGDTALTGYHKAMAGMAPVLSAGARIPAFFNGVAEGGWNHGLQSADAAGADFVNKHENAANNAWTRVENRVAPVTTWHTPAVPQMASAAPIAYPQAQQQQRPQGGVAAGAAPIAQGMVPNMNVTQAAQNMIPKQASLTPFAALQEKKAYGMYQMKEPNGPVAATPAINPGSTVGKGPGAMQPVAQGSSAGPGVIPSMTEAVAPPPAGAAGPAGAGLEGPDDAYLAKVMGSYDANSSLDQRKADVIRQQWQASGGKLTPDQVYSNPAYVEASQRKQAALTPFAAMGEMEKQGFTAIAKGLRWAGNKLHGSASTARKATRGALSDGRRSLSHQQANIDALERNTQNLPSARRMSTMKEIDGLNSTMAQQNKTVGSLENLLKTQGKTRFGAADKLQGWANNLENAPGWAHGTALGAGGLGIYGLGRSGGHATGREQGLAEGYDTGSQFGMQSAMQAMPRDPGFLGRIADVFTGSDSGPDPAMLQQFLAQNKDSIIQQILASR